MNFKVFLINVALVSAQSSLNKFFSNQDINQQLSEKGVDTDVVSTTEAPSVTTTSAAQVNNTATDIKPTHQPSEVNQYNGGAYNPYEPNRAESDNGENQPEVFNMTSYILNLQMMPPEEITVRPLDPESIELKWKIPTNLRRDKLKFNIILKYYNTRQTAEQASEVKITKVYLANERDEFDRPKDGTLGKFILRDLTRYIEYSLSLYVKIYLNVPDFERPGMMKEIEKESYPSSWKRVRTDANIFSGFFNFTKGKYHCVGCFG